MANINKLHYYAPSHSLSLLLTLTFPWQRAKSWSTLIESTFFPIPSQLSHSVFCNRLNMCCEFGRCLKGTSNAHSDTRTILQMNQHRPSDFDCSQGESQSSKSNINTSNRKRMNGGNSRLQWNMRELQFQCHLPDTCFFFLALCESFVRVRRMIKCEVKENREK